MRLDILAVIEELEPEMAAILQKFAEIYMNPEWFGVSQQLDED